MAKRLLLASCFLLSAVFTASAQDQICKLWFNAEKDAKIEIYLAKDGKYYGRIVWLKEPNDPDSHQPKTDKENPDKAKRNTPVQGLVILRGLTKSTDSPGLYEGGTVYDPNNGKTYSCKLTYHGNMLDLRGYVLGITWLGRTSTWSLAQ